MATPIYSLEYIRERLLSATPEQLDTVNTLVQRALRDERLKEHEWAIARERTLRIAAALYHGDASAVRGCEHFARFQTRQEWLDDLRREHPDG
jgi:hypothetical protein